MSTKLEAIAARRTKALDEAEALIREDGSFASDADRERFDALKGEASTLLTSYQTLASLAEARAAQPAVAVFNGNGDQTGRADPVTGVITKVHDRAVDKPWGADTGAGFGEYLSAVRRAGLGLGLDSRLAAASGMNEATGADGGYAVPVEFASGIEKEMWETGQILSRVSARPISGNAITFNAIDETSRADGSRRGGLTAYWVDEGTAPDASQIKLAPVEMKLRKVAALGFITEELMEDAPALQAELTEAFREELLFEVEDAILNGSGAGAPLGILRAPCLISVAKVTGQSAATVEKDNVDSMFYRMRPGDRANGVWLVNTDVEPQLNSMVMVIGTGGVPVYLPPGGLASAPLGTLYGRPVIPTEYNAALGTIGDIMWVNLSRYRVIRKASGPQFSSSMHVRFTQGEQTFRATYRVDGQPIPRSAITPKNSINTLSPFVALATRA